MKMQLILFPEHATVSGLLILMIFLVSIIAFRRPSLIHKLLLHPNGIVKGREYYRLFTSAFIHNDWLHLLANGYMLSISCINLERYLCTVNRFGSLIFLGVYLFANLSGTVLVSLRHYQDPAFTSAGASGIVMGCMFCFMVLQPDFIAFYLPGIGPVKNIFAALIFILLLIRLQYKNNTFLNHEMHFYASLSGLAAGILISRYIL